MEHDQEHRDTMGKPLIFGSTLNLKINGRKEPIQLTVKLRGKGTPKELTKDQAISVRVIGNLSLRLGERGTVSFFVEELILEPAFDPRESHHEIR